MSTRKHMQEVLKSPSMVAALARYRKLERSMITLRHYLPMLDNGIVRVENQTVGRPTEDEALRHMWIGDEDERDTH